MNFNPTEYTMEMRIIGYGLMVAGALLLILVSVLGTGLYQNSQRYVEDERD